jgi:PPM family protein phosphatase
MKLRHSAQTDVGKTRDHNEDSYGVGEGDQVERLGELLVICDGMGGHASGEVASRLGVDTILQIYYGDDAEDRPVVLEQAFEQANQQIFARGRGSMGTTGVAALIHHDALHVANVGDSRAYLIRGGEIRQVSRDHSFVSDQVAAGLITADQARSSPHRNVITRALGYQAGVTVDLFRLPLQVGDVVVLSSDGLHGLVTDAEIARTAAAEPPEVAVKQLIDLANQRGGTDNITVVVVRVDSLDWDSEPIDESEPDIHERVTVELPIPTNNASPTAAPTVARPAAPPAGSTSPQDVSTAPEPGTAAAIAEPAPAPAPPRPRPSVERRLTLLGGLLAVLLLVVLMGVILFAMTPAPTPNDTPISSPAPTTQATAVPGTALPTGSPAGAPTVGPPASTPTP